MERALRVQHQLKTVGNDWHDSMAQTAHAQSPQHSSVCSISLDGECEREQFERVMKTMKTKWGRKKMQEQFSLVSAG
jgi:hypothetical protein